MENTIIFDGAEVSVDPFAIPGPPPGWDDRYYRVQEVLQSHPDFEFWSQLDDACQRAISRGCPPLSFDMDLVMPVWYRHQGKPLKRPTKRERRKSCPFPMGLNDDYSLRRLSPPGPLKLAQNDCVGSQVPAIEESEEEKLPTWFPALKKLLIRRFLLRHVGVPISPQPSPSCTICFEKLQIAGLTDEEILMEEQRGETVEREPAAVLPCGHIVGKNCIETFRQTEADGYGDSQCPVCRFDLRPEGCYHHCIYPIRDISKSEDEFFWMWKDICPDIDSLVQK